LTTNGQQMAFIFSTGRTGTDFFTTLFNEQVSNAWSLHEPNPAFRARSYQLVSRAPNLYKKLYFKIPRQWRHRKHPEKWYVETNYHLFAAIPLIRSTFPAGKLVHIVRDGRKVVTSWLNRYRYITNDHITPYDLTQNPARASWKQWNPLQKLSWYWKTVNEMVESQDPDLWLKFENIFQGPEHKDLFTLLEHLPGIDYDEAEIKALAGQSVNKNSIKFFPDYEGWPQFWKDQFWEIAGDTMTHYGYRE